MMANVVINSCHDCPFISAMQVGGFFLCLLPTYINDSRFTDVTDSAVQFKQDDDCILRSESVSFSAGSEVQGGAL